MSEWQLIETAPKDGTMILLASGRHVFPGWWDESYTSFPWIIVDMAHRCVCEGGSIAALANAADEGFPTHWQPLPTPPDTEIPQQYQPK